LDDFPAGAPIIVNSADFFNLQQRELTGRNSGDNMDG